MFRKVVSYLAYSPAMLWKLSELDKKNKRDLKDTNWSILLLVMSILMLLILWLGQPKTSLSPKEAKTRKADFAMNGQTSNYDGIVTKIELERHVHKIKPSQAISFVLSATNTTEQTFSGNLSIDLSQAAKYLTAIPNANSLTIENQTTSWPIKNLASNETTQVTMRFQSLNNFGLLLTNKNDTCNVTIDFGNQINIPVECSNLKLAQIKLTNLGKNEFYYALIVTILVIILIIKILFRTELKLNIKQTQLIRREINHGRFSL